MCISYLHVPVHTFICGTVVGVCSPWFCVKLGLLAPGNPFAPLGLNSSYDIHSIIQTK